MDGNIRKSSLDSRPNQPGRARRSNGVLHRHLGYPAKVPPVVYRKDKDNLLPPLVVKPLPDAQAKSVESKKSNKDENQVAVTGNEKNSTGVKNVGDHTKIKITRGDPDALVNASFSNRHNIESFESESPLNRRTSSSVNKPPTEIEKYKLNQSPERERSPATVSEPEERPTGIAPAAIAVKKLSNLLPAVGIGICVLVLSFLTLSLEAKWNYQSSLQVNGARSFILVSDYDLDTSSMPASLLNLFLED